MSRFVNCTITLDMGKATACDAKFGVHKINPQDHNNPLFILSHSLSCLLSVLSVYVSDRPFCALEDVESRAYSMEDWSRGSISVRNQWLSRNKASLPLLTLSRISWVMSLAIRSTARG